MTRHTDAPKWKAYEERVYALFREHLPAARVRRNVKVRGRYSKRKRQIDILITEDTPVGKLRTVVDAKYFGRKVNVKAVDGLAGFVDDVACQRGMLITNVGYTPAALRRAFYGPSSLELDVLNFSDLQRFQALAAVPYVGHRGFMVRAPFGWVVDGARFEGALATLYQRGLDAATAKRRKELVYINFWDRRSHPLSAAELDALQTINLRRTGPVVIHRPATIHRDDAVARLRIADVKAYHRLEVTGFLEFDDVIFFAVLLTPKETQRPNIRRLESILQQAVPIDLVRDNTRLIEAIQARLNESPPASERAQLLLDQGHWYRDMDRFDEARRALEEGLTLDPHNYYAVGELLPVLEKLGDKEGMLLWLGRLLRLDPHNPTVFNDSLQFAQRGAISAGELVALIDTLKDENPGDQLTHASCNFYAAQLLATSAPDLARQRFEAAEQSFRQVLPQTHQVFSALRAAEARLGMGG